MSLAVRPNYPRGEVILDPIFYTSSPFVEPFRADIEQLLQTFKVQYTVSPPPRRVFSLFKELWRSTGWSFLHLSVLEDLDRDAFTLTVFRLFLERIHEKELPIIRAGALFGLYISFYTQPHRVLRSQAQIPIAIDTLSSLPKLFEVGPADFSCYTTYILDRFSSTSAFLVIPASHLFPYNTRNLPHALLVTEQPDANKKKKAGRKSKKEKGQLAIAGIKTLEKIVDDDFATSSDEMNVAESYESVKQRMMERLPEKTIRAAEIAVARKLPSAFGISPPAEDATASSSSYGPLLKVKSSSQSIAPEWAR